MDGKMIYLKDNIASSFIEALPGWTLADCFSAEFLADCLPWREGVTQGMIYDPETDTFSEPPPATEPEPPVNPFEETREAMEILTGGKDDELD